MSQVDSLNSPLFFREWMLMHRQLKLNLLAIVFTALISVPSMAQPGGAPTGDVVPREVREIYEKGLQYLLDSQTDGGNWQDGYSGPGTTGMAMMAFLASGEDPNFGKYSIQIRRALRSLIRSQDVSTGYMGDSMYQHGFAMLALAEAYGAVDEMDLWEGQTGAKQRSVGEVLELAVRCAITSQSKNPHQAWRYSPNARDADTSVSGAILMGLLAARNAGIEVPDGAIDKAIGYFTSMTGDSGVVGYSGGMGGFGQSIVQQHRLFGIQHCQAKRLEPIRSCEAICHQEQ